MRKTVPNTALWTALVVSLGVSLSACSGGEGSHEVLAVDRVEAAAELARANAPEAEDFEFAETESVLTTMATPEEGAVDASADMDGAEVAEATGGEDLATNVGAQIYDNQCTVCHAAGLLGAPAYGDAAAWAPRIEKGLDTLTDHSANGFNQMPAQAVNGVTEDQIRAAVEYMVEAAS